MKEEKELRFVEEFTFKEKCDKLFSDRFKKNWKKFGSVILIVIMWIMIIFSNNIFGVTHGQTIESLIVGIASLLFITTISTEDADWFGVKKLGHTTFWVLGISNLIIGIALFLI